MPRKIVVDAPRPSAPPMFMVFWSRKEKDLYDQGKNSPVKEKPGQCPDHEHQRKGLEGEDEVRSRVLKQEGRRSAADVAEHEGRARPGCRFERQHQRYSGAGRTFLKMGM